MPLIVSKTPKTSPQSPPPRHLEARLAEAVVNEADWVERARNGEIGAFSRLVELYQERAVRAAYAFTGNFEDARDLAQDAFVKAYENLKSFRAKSSFYTWFYRILSNACKDHLRKKKVRSAILFWSRREEEPGEERAENRIVDGSRTAKEELLNKELGDEIGHAIQCLPLQQRQAFLLRYLDGMSLEEVSVSMRLSVGAVKAHLWQAAQKMKVSMNRYLEDGGGLS